MLLVFYKKKEEISLWNSDVFTNIFKNPSLEEKVYKKPEKPENPEKIENKSAKCMSRLRRVATCDANGVRSAAPQAHYSRESSG